MKELTNDSKWSRAPENHHSVKRLQVPKTAYYLNVKKKKKTRTKNTYLFLSNDTRSVLLFKISLVKTTVTLAHDYQTAT